MIHVIEYRAPQANPCGMPRFFFHLHECGTVFRDDEGRELPDLVEAQTTAIHEARSVMAAEVMAGRLCLDCRIEVCDADDHLLLNVSFRAALAVTGT